MHSLPPGGGGSGWGGHSGPAAVEYLIAQFIGANVGLPADMNEAHGMPKAIFEPHRFLIKRPQSRILDAILAVHLLHHQLAVAVDDHALIGAKVEGVFQGAD